MSVGEVSSPPEQVNSQVWQTLVWERGEVIQVNVAVRDTRTGSEVAIRAIPVGPFDRWEEELWLGTRAAIDSVRDQLSQQLSLFD